jgi:hypothetical protein
MLGVQCVAIECSTTFFGIQARLFQKLKITEKASLVYGDMFEWRPPHKPALYWLNNELLGAHGQKVLQLALTLHAGSFIATLQPLPISRPTRGHAAPGAGLGACFTNGSESVTYIEYVANATTVSWGADAVYPFYIYMVHPASTTPKIVGCTDGYVGVYSDGGKRKHVESSGSDSGDESDDGSDGRSDIEQLSSSDGSDDGEDGSDGGELDQNLRRLYAAGERAGEAERLGRGLRGADGAIDAWATDTCINGVQTSFPELVILREQHYTFEGGPTLDDSDFYPMTTAIFIAMVRRYIHGDKSEKLTRLFCGESDVAGWILTPTTGASSGNHWIYLCADGRHNTWYASLLPIQALRSCCWGAPEPIFIHAVLKCAA